MEPLGKGGDRSVRTPELLQNAASGGVRERAERGIEVGLAKLNHMVQYITMGDGMQWSAAAPTAADQGTQQAESLTSIEASDKTAGFGIAQMRIVHIRAREDVLQDGSLEPRCALRFLLSNSSSAPPNPRMQPTNAWMVDGSRWHQRRTLDTLRLYPKVDAH